MLLVKKVYQRISFVAKMSENIKRQAARAQRVQDNVLNHQYTIEMEAKIRTKVSIESSIEQLQNQMRQQIARSLKKSEMTVICLIKKANELYLEHQKVKKSQTQIQTYNQLITQCQKARWQFMVHRQAVGFTIKNYELVTSIYKIPPKLLLKDQ